METTGGVLTRRRSVGNCCPGKLRWSWPGRLRWRLPREAEVELAREAEMEAAQGG
jgi:hypothetical protein